MSRIVLFGSPLSPFVEKVRRALTHKKVEYELVEPRSPGDFKRWNPQTRKMPVLEVDGERIIDSTLICDRLDEFFPEPPLLSKQPATRASQRLLEDWCDESLYWYLMALRWTEKNAPATAAQITSGLPALMRPIARRMLTRQIGGMARAQGMGRLPVEAVVGELGERLDDLLALLGERPFFFADEPSRADLALYGMLQMGLSGPTPEVNQLVGERPGLAPYLERVREATSA
jgi:glutathione S-transferase